MIILTQLICRELYNTDSSFISTTYGWFSDGLNTIYNGEVYDSYSDGVASGFSMVYEKSAGVDDFNIRQFHTEITNSYARFYSYEYLGWSTYIYR